MRAGVDARTKRARDGQLARQPETAGGKESCFTCDIRNDSKEKKWTETKEGNYKKING